jgi:hypothetical protein
MILSPASLRLATLRVTKHQNVTAIILMVLLIILSIGDRNFGA